MRVSSQGQYFWSVIHASSLICRHKTARVLVCIPESSLLTLDRRASSSLGHHACPPHSTVLRRLLPDQGRDGDASVAKLRLAYQPTTNNKPESAKTPFLTEPWDYELKSLKIKEVQRHVDFNCRPSQTPTNKITIPKSVEDYLPRKLKNQRFGHEDPSCDMYQRMQARSVELNSRKSLSQCTIITGVFNISLKSCWLGHVIQWFGS